MDYDCQMEQTLAIALQDITRFIDGMSQLWNPETPPLELFHYTTTEGFIGIITSRTLWASDMLSLNDASESMYPCQVITKVLESQVNIPAGHRNRFAAQLKEYLFRIETPFVVCFCEDGDLLSQWRGYGSDGEGFALGFSFSWLQFLDTSDFRLQKVIYEFARQEELILMLLDRVPWMLTQAPFTEEDEERLWSHAAASLAPWVVMFKDPSFAEEREWRLVRRTPFPPPYSFRRSGHRIVPYVKVPISDCEVITSIIRGPYFGGTEMRGAYIMTVTNGFIRAAKIRDSRIPLRQ
jgi:Protein of unknown function (DUF2971)